MRAQEALDLHADLTARLENSAFQEGLAQQMSVHEVFVANNSVARKNIALERSRVAAKNAAEGIKNAETFFVSKDMTELVLAGSEVMDKTDIADPTLVPSPHGFCYFEKGVPLTDVRGKQMIVNAMLWVKVSDDFYRVHLMNDSYREPDEIAQEVSAEILTPSIMKIYGRWGYIGVVNYQGQIGPLEFDTSEYRTLLEEEGDSDFAEVSDNPRPIVHSLFLMLNQTIVDVSQEEADRKLARRMKFMKLPTMVTVIQLRRKKYQKKHEGETAVEWSHRWHVRGFWRWQWYKNEEKEWTKKRIWIDPQIRGPEDKPLIVTKKVNALVR